MDEEFQTRRVTIRLTPFQARRLWKLRTASIPEGARPRTVTEVIVHALLDAARALDHGDPAQGELANDERVIIRDGAVTRPGVEVHLEDESIPFIMNGADEGHHP